MSKKLILVSSDNYNLYIDSLDDALWFEIVDSYLELEFNGNDYTRICLGALTSNDLKEIAEALNDYIEAENSIE